jgi:hypothetical protein
VIELVDFWLVLMLPPKPQQIWSPLFWLTVFEAILAVAYGHPSGGEAGCSRLQVGGLPEAEGHGIVGLIITGMAMDQMMRPDVTLVGSIVQRGHVVERLAIVGSPGISKAQPAFGLHLGPWQTLQESQTSLVEGTYGQRTRGSEALQTTLMAYIKDEEAIHAVDGCVFRDN